MSLLTFSAAGAAPVPLAVRLGRTPTVEKNNSSAAIGMQTVNHPHSRHLTADVYDGDLDEECEGRAVGWFHMSPDCPHHSPAARRERRDPQSVMDRPEVGWLE